MLKGIYTYLFTNTEYDSAEIDKAVRWAPASAMHTQVASLTAFVLPYWPFTAYHRWLRHVCTAVDTDTLRTV